MDWSQIGWVDFNLVFLPAAREEGYVVSNNNGDTVFLFNESRSLVNEYPC